MKESVGRGEGRTVMGKVQVQEMLTRIWKVRVYVCSANVLLWGVPLSPPQRRYSDSRHLQLCRQNFKMDYLETLR